MGATFSRTTQSLKKRLNKFRGRRSPTPPLEPIVAFSEAPPLEQRQPTRKLTSANLNRIAAERRRRKAAGTGENNKPLRPITLKRMINKNRLGKTPSHHSSLVPNSALTLQEKRNRQNNKKRREKEKEELSQQQAFNRKIREEEEDKFREELELLAKEFF
jgi:hypothetical protein